MEFNPSKESHRPSVMQSLRNSRMGILLTAGIATITLLTVEAGALAAPEPAGADNVPADIRSYDLLSADTAAQPSDQVIHSRSSLNPKSVLKSIHDSLNSFSIDILSLKPKGDDICGLRGLPGVNVPKYPKCKHVSATITSAYLAPDSGGFKTKCDDPEASTYHFYDINTVGQKYHTCGPGPVPGGIGGHQETTPGEFQKKLNRQGDIISKSVGLGSQAVTARVSGTRGKITATYSCPAPSTASGSAETTTAGKNAKRIVIRRNHTASAAIC